jgi:ATP-binding cassette subfamily B protein
MFRKLFALSQQGEKDLKKGIIASAAAQISLMLPVGLLLLVLDELLQPLVGKEASTPNVLAYTGFAFVLLGVMFITNLIEYQFTYVAAYEESANRRVALAEKLRKLPLSFFGHRDLANLTTTMMGDCTNLERTFSHAIPQLFGAIISILIITIGLFLMEWHMALAVFIVLPVALIITIGSKKLQDKAGLNHVEAKLAASDRIQEFFDTIKDIKACNQEEKYLSNLDEKFDEVIKTAIRSELTAGTMIASSQMILRFGFVFVVLTGANLLAEGKIDFLKYLVFLITAARIYDPLSTIMMQIGEIFNSQLQIRRMKEIASQPVQAGGDCCNNQGYDLNFNHVDFSYIDEGDAVLKDVSFTAKQGEVTALVGPSGSGKSTVAKLAARFWDVTGGSITLGGVDVTTVEPETLLKNYSIVFQDVVLFNDTVMENIRLGRRNATDEEVIAAAKAARCDVFITRFPDGYKTIIGENGSTLSGGERQRISIARALLKDSPIILLDEPTASLDVENETLVQDALSRLIQNKTVLVIAHRMRTISGADKIVVLGGGSVVQQGSPEELMQQGGLYKHMAQLQQQSSQWALSGGATDNPFRDIKSFVLG